MLEEGYESWKKSSQDNDLARGVVQFESEPYLEGGGRIGGILTCNLRCPCCHGRLEWIDFVAIDLREKEDLCWGEDPCWPDE